MQAFGGQAWTSWVEVKGWGIFIFALCLSSLSDVMKCRSQH